MLESFHFLRPLWLLAVLPVLALWWLWSRRANAHSQFTGRIDPALLDVLLDSSASQRHNLAPLLVAIGSCIAVIGIAGPTWERLPQPVERDGDGLVIVLDLSLSMYVKDVPPSRLVRARQKITDVLRARRQGFTGLIAYAGDAHTVAPLTDDTDTISNLLGSLAPEMMPVLGSDTGAAIELAQGLLRSAGLLQGRILLVTDGIDRISDVTGYRSREYPISILGVGTPEGAPIPLDFAKQPGQVLQTQQGDIIRARLDDARLQEVAELSYGRYRRAGLSDNDINALLSTPLPSTDTTVDTERQFDQWADRGYWLALLLVPLAAMAFRKGTFATAMPMAGSPILGAGLLGALLAGTPSSAQAGWWDDLWQRRDQQAHQSLIEGSPERAATLFERDDWRAIANYRSGEYEAARDAFAEALNLADTDPNSDTHNNADDLADELDNIYNLGNAQARIGQYEEALDSYAQVLQLTPDHEDAAFNSDLVEKLLQQQQQASEQENSENQQDQGQDGEQSRDNENSQNDQDQQPQEQAQEQQSEQEQNAEQERQQSEPQKGDEQQEEQQAQVSRDENTEAMEQWLRRVPDDPGGLLRRKFQHETNKRLRSGDSRRAKDQKIW